MSGPKTGSYTVISGAEVKQVLDQTLAQARSIQSSFMALAAEAGRAQENYGNLISNTLSPPAIPIVGGYWKIVKIEEWIDASRKLFLEQSARLRREIKTAELEALRLQREADILVKASNALRGDTAGTAIEASAVIPRLDEVTPEQFALEFGDALSKVYSQLDIDVDAADRKRLEALVEDAISSRLAERQAKEQHLQFEIRSINQVWEGRRNRRLAHIALREKLSSLPGSEIATARSLVEASSADDREVDETLRKTVSDAVDAAVGRANRIFVQEQAAAAFEELGYELQEGFSTLLATGKPAHVHSVEMKGYAVRVQQHRDGEMQFRVVRDAALGGDENLRDREVEELWCSDFADLIAVVDDNGVEMAATYALEPGEISVQRVDDFPFQAVAAPRSKQDIAEQRLLSKQMFIPSGGSQ